MGRGGAPVDGHYQFEDDIRFSDLQNNQEAGFLSIGSRETPFRGTFDGNGHTIW